MEPSQIHDLRITEAINQSSQSFDFMGRDLIIFDQFRNLSLPSQEVWKLDSIFIIFCTSGMARFSVNTEERTIQSGQVTIINANEVVDSCLFSPNFDAILLCMSQEFSSEVMMSYQDLSSILLFVRRHPVVMLTEEECDMFMSYYRMLKSKVANHSHRFQKSLVRTLLLAMLYDMGNIVYTHQQVNEKSKKRADAILVAFIRLVETNFRVQRRVSWYAEQLCITPKYLSSTVKNASSRTPNEWIDYYVVLEARVQLRNTAKSIKEISRDLCFPNQSFFGKFFKEHSGMSPSAYRKK